MKRIRIGSYEIIYANGKVEEIFVGLKIRDANAVLFRPSNSPRRKFKLLQYYRRKKSWGIVNMTNPLLFTPVKIEEPHDPLIFP